MILFFVLSLLSAIGTIIYGVNQEQIELTRQLRDSERAALVEKTSSAVRDFYSDFNRYPVDLQELIDEEYGLFLNHTGFIELPVSYAIEQDINDGLYIFDRVAVYATRLADDTPPADYLLGAQNACGNTDFDDPASFCMANNLYADSFDNRREPSYRLELTRERLTRTLGDFIVGFNFNQESPALLPLTGTRMGDGDAEELVDIVGFPGTPANCNNQKFRFDGVTLDCDDLFAPMTGAPIVYYKITEENFALISETGNTDNLGNPVLTGVEFLVGS